MISIHRYTDEDKSIWNSFNKESKNSIFMFDRNYMDYHRDRFTDHSLMFYDDDKLVALLPMCEKGIELLSHGGLTYGGFITSSKMKQHTMNGCFDALVEYSRGNDFKRITYKTIPHIYHKQASEEDKYALYANEASLITIDASTYINLKSSLKMEKGRKAQISRAKREGVIIEELTTLEDYNLFIEMENEVLGKRHDTTAVHTGEELKKLHDSFPNGIHLIAAKREDRMVAGTIVFEYDQAVHTQYMASNDEGRMIGALDLAVNYVIEKYRESKLWLDFGISTEHGRVYLNEGLIQQKEGFGGRTGVYEIWEICI
jgi:hypothetical protein